MIKTKKRIKYYCKKQLTKLIFKGKQDYSETLILFIRDEKHILKNIGISN